jgi:hypothetical protein
MILLTGGLPLAKSCGLWLVMAKVLVGLTAGLVVKSLGCLLSFLLCLLYLLKDGLLVALRSDVRKSHGVFT